MTPILLLGNFSKTFIDVIFYFSMYFCSVSDYLNKRICMYARAWSFPEIYPKNTTIFLDNFRGNGLYFILFLDFIF